MERRSGFCITLVQCRTLSVAPSGLTIRHILSIKEDDLHKREDDVGENIEVGHNRERDKVLGPCVSVAE